MLAYIIVLDLQNMQALKLTITLNDGQLRFLPQIDQLLSLKHAVSPLRINDEFFNRYPVSQQESKPSIVC